MKNWFKDMKVQIITAEILYTMSYYRDTPSRPSLLFSLYHTTIFFDSAKFKLCANKMIITEMIIFVITGVKTLREKEKLLVTSTFSFYGHVFKRPFPLVIQTPDCKLLLNCNKFITLPHVIDFTHRLWKKFQIQRKLQLWDFT